MPKTKSQAEKRHEHEIKRREKEKELHEQREARALEFQQLQQQSLPREQVVSTESACLSRKERRKLKALNKQEETPESGKAECLEETLTLSQPIEDKPDSKKDTVTAQAVKDTLEQEAAKDDAVARVVQNHSTYCAGLKPVLMKLQKSLGTGTIIPGVISQASSNCEKFALRVQRLEGNTYKLLARNGHTVQEVSISVSDPRIFTAGEIKRHINDILEKNTNTDATEESDPDLNYSDYNRSLAEGRNSFWKERHQKQHQQNIEREKQHAKEKEIDKQRRKLANKDLAPGEKDAYAERDVNIISGESRTKNSMK